MTDESLATLVIGYLVGCMVTLFSIDAPSRTGFVERRIFLWPLYWSYLIVKMAFMLVHELRR